MCKNVDDFTAQIGLITKLPEDKRLQGFKKFTDTDIFSDVRGEDTETFIKEIFRAISSMPMSQKPESCLALCRTESFTAAIKYSTQLSLDALLNVAFFLKQGRLNLFGALVKEPVFLIAAQKNKVAFARSTAIFIANSPNEQKQDLFKILAGSPAFNLLAEKNAFECMNGVKTIIHSIPDMAGKAQILETLLLSSSPETRRSVKLGKEWAELFDKAGWKKIETIASVRHPDDIKIAAYCSPNGAVILTGGCFVGSPDALVAWYAGRKERQHKVQGPLSEAFSDAAKNSEFDRWQRGGLAMAARTLHPHISRR